MVAMLGAQQVLESCLRQQGLHLLRVVDYILHSLGAHLCALLCHRHRQVQALPTFFELDQVPVSYTHLTLPTIYSV